MVVSCDACMVACSFTGSKQNNVQDVYTKCTCRRMSTHSGMSDVRDYDTSEHIVHVSVCDAQAKRVVLPLYPLKMPFNVGAAFLFSFSFGCLCMYVMRFRSANNISESDKCKLNTMRELDWIKNERENKMPKKSMAIAIRFSIHKQKIPSFC